MKFRAYKYRAYRSIDGIYEVVFDNSAGGWLAWRRNDDRNNMTQLGTTPMHTAEGGFAICARDRKKRKEADEGSKKEGERESLHQRLFKIGPSQSQKTSASTG